MTTTEPTAAPARRQRTRQRDAVESALARADGFVSAQQLHAELRLGGERVGLATVYRALQTMADDGAVDVVRSNEGEAMYRRCSTGHHHHLTCRVCRRTVEVDSAAVERWAQNVAAENGFADVSHVIEVFGTCRGCVEAPLA